MGGGRYDCAGNETERQPMKPNVLIAGLLAGAALMGQTLAARADAANLVVVELFTSQGCSSCPPADALLNKLAQRSDVLPLALHVDYWDYIGWADSFARPEHTTRQKAYAHVAGSRTIYTPQMVIGGDDQIVGARPMDVADAVMKHLHEGPGVAITLEPLDGGMRVVATPTQARLGSMLVQLVRFVPIQTVSIERGENAGKTVTYSNVVTNWEVVGEWGGGAPLDLEIPVPGDDAAAVVLQKVGNGRIVAASRLR